MVNQTNNNINTNTKQNQEQEDPQDSFIDSLLNFDNWVEDNNITLIMDSNKVCGSENLLLGDVIQQGLDKVLITSLSGNDDLKQVNEVMEVVSEVNEEKVCGSEKDLIQQGLDKVSIASPLVNDDVKQENEVMEVSEFNEEKICGSEKDLIQQGLDKVSIASPLANDVKQENEVMEVISEVNEEKICLTQQGLDKVSIASPSGNDDAKQENEVMEVISEVNEEKICGSEKLLLGDLIQEGLDKVSITSLSANDDVKQENEVMEVESESSDDEEGSSSSASSSSSSSSDSSSEEEEEEGKEVGEVEVEEGEMSEKMVSWSDEDEDVVKGPVRSKNEVKDLPPVPPVTATIQPHHQTLPVGVVLSIMGAQVIVEGVDNHNPLSDGSILWITECRSPLGVVDEIFGPVKNPYYIVRFNSESEVPAGIEQGSLISFVPEFADYVLKDNSLYKKGYDASGENDEELSEELEFSDDEKEAEYRKMKKMAKRGSSEQTTNGNMKKDKKSRNQGGNSKIHSQPSPNTHVSGSSSSGPTSGPQVFSPSPQAPSYNGPRPSGVPQNGFAAIQPQNMVFPPNMFPSNVPFMQPNMMQQQFQNIGLPNFTPFNPQFNNSGQMFPLNFLQGLPPNFGVNPAFASWPTGMPQNNFNQSPVFNQLQVGPAGMPPQNNFNQSQVRPSGMPQNNFNQLPVLNQPQVGLPGVPQNNFNQSQVRPSGMPQNNFNQSQVGPAMAFQSLPQGAVMPNGFQMQNNGTARPSQNTNRGNGFSKRGGRGGGQFRGGRSGPPPS